MIIYVIYIINILLRNYFKKSREYQIIWLNE